MTSILIISLSLLTETPVKAIEDAFKEFTSRDDIAIVLVSQYVSIALLSRSIRICLIVIVLYT